MSATATVQEPTSKADQILARLDEVLQEVDIDIVTINQITNKLAEELGGEVYDYKAMLKVIACCIAGDVGLAYSHLSRKLRRGVHLWQELK